MSFLCGIRYWEERSREFLLIVIGRDAFAGGFVAGIVQGKELDECVDMGHWLASLSIQELGPQYVASVLHFPLLNEPVLQLSVYSNAKHEATSCTIDHPLFKHI